MNIQDNWKKISLITAITAIVVVASIATVTAFRKPASSDYASAQTLVSDASKTQDALLPVVNSYLAAFSKELNATGSVTKAKENTSKEFEVFAKAESSALEAIKKLVDSKAANSGDVSKAIGQLDDVYTKRTNYIAGMVRSYADLGTLFGGVKNDVCSDLFIGGTADLTERKDLLKKATGNCYEAIDTVKQSKNSSYVEYAYKLERRVKQLEQDAAVIASSEKKYNELLKQVSVFQQRADDAKARNASEQELFALADEIKAVNETIKENQADFTFSSNRYLSTVKELPSLYESIYATDVPAKLSNFKSLTEVRLTTLQLILDDKLIN